MGPRRATEGGIRIAAATGGAAASPRRSPRNERLDGSVKRRRVSKRAWEFDSDAAVGVRDEPGGVGQLAEPAAVGAHGEELTAVDVRMKRVARGVEQDRLRHRVLNVELPPDTALRGAVHPASRNDAR